MGRGKARPRARARGEEEEEEAPSAAKYLLAAGQDDGAEDNRHALYQRAVQTPKGDISYLCKFFLTYVGGRIPLHLREDFCGTALICTEWLRGDSRRTATGLDLDSDALTWGIRNNLSSLPGGGGRRMCMLLGNVLRPIAEAELLGPHGTCDRENEGNESERSENEGLLEEGAEESLEDGGREGKHGIQLGLGENSQRDIDERLGENEGKVGENGEDAGPSGDWKGADPLSVLEALRDKEADIVCAFNFSTCCLHERKDLVRYFKHVKGSISKAGGVFALDLYGGMSSECALKLKRRFQNFTYTWEQEEFDVVTRMTRISLHFRLQASNRQLRRAFSYQWRLWTIPEVRDCLHEAGFKEVHVWMREMPELRARENEDDEVQADPNLQFRQETRFLQCDSWNAYVVAVV